MARQRRTLDEQIAELVTRGRSERGTVLSTPAMAGLGSDMIEDDAITNDHLSPGAVRLENLDEEISSDLADMNDALGKAKDDLAELEESLNEARREVVDIDGRLDEAALDLVDAFHRIDNEVLPAINDAAASPITDARLSAGSITVWPFIQNSVPKGALAIGAVGANELADFSVVAKKFKDNRHRIY